MNNKFLAGTIVATRSTSEMLRNSQEEHDFIRGSLLRHLSCDWGDLAPEDKEMNDQALENGERLFSAYENGDVKIWIITDADRLHTTILFPHEY